MVGEDVEPNKEENVKNNEKMKKKKKKLRVNALFWMFPN